MTPVLIDSTAAPAVPTATRPRITPGDAQLAVAGVLLVSVALGALYLMVRPGPTILDHWALTLVPARHRSHFLATVTRLASLPVVVAGITAGALAAVRRDRARALALVVGPCVAVVAADWCMKPAVGRTFEGVLCFPSGTVVAVAAMATAASLAASPAWRCGVAALGAACVAVTALAVVALGWHYPTDALAGAATGIGVVLAVDVAAHRLAARLHAEGPTTSNRGAHPSARGTPPAAAER